MHEFSSFLLADQSFDYLNLNEKKKGKKQSE